MKLDHVPWMHGHPVAQLDKVPYVQATATSQDESISQSLNSIKIALSNDGLEGYIR